MNKYLKRICLFLLVNTVAGNLCAAKVGDFTDISPSFAKQRIPIQSPLKIFFQLGDRPDDLVELNIVNYPNGASDLLFVHVHENEFTSRAAGLSSIERIGGTLIYIKNRGLRELNARIGKTEFTLDPNRIFTKKGLDEKISPRPSPAQSKVFLSFANWLKRNIQTALSTKRKKLVTALHNNTDDNTMGRLLSIETERDIIGIDNESVYQNQIWDIDNFFIATQRPTFSLLTQKLAANASLRLPKPRDIGYMSNWMIEQKTNYINIETQIGDDANNEKMIQLVQDSFQ
jgi:hypothetical protein